MILLIDDNDLVRGWAGRTLRKAGFVVLEAQLAATAIGLLQAFAVALVIQDYVMPDGGESLFLRVKAIVPDVPVMVFTGLSPEYVSHVPFDGYLEKPCATKALLAAVAGFVAPP